MLSQINPSVSFSEMPNVAEIDLNQDAAVYSATIFDQQIFLSAGQIQTIHQSRGVLFRPVYLVHNDNKVSRIGLVEFSTSDVRPVLRESDFIATRLFSFVDKNLLVRSTERTDEIIDKAKNIGIDNAEPTPVFFPITEHRNKIFIQEKGIMPLTIISDDHVEYIPSSNDDWINVFMKSRDYTLRDNEGSGDCLFVAIRDAFDSIHQRTTVQKLRNYLSEHATEDTFQQYKTAYDNISSVLQNETKELKELEEKHRDMRKQFAAKVDKAEMQRIANEASELTKRHKKLASDKKASEKIAREWKFMKGVQTLSDFKEKIRKCDFWADIWAISTLERILNIKLIILSSEYYGDHDEKNVIQCGHAIDDVIKKTEVFRPDAYILLDYTGSHYRLIGYKTRYLFHHNELPNKIKQLIQTKCMERNAGIYTLIPDFQKNNEIGNIELDQSEHTLSEPNMFNDNIVFQFYSKSTDKPYPGKGSGEKIPDTEILRFRSLSQIPQWRKKLSNFWEAPFELDGLRWNSVEHYYQASKFKQSHPEYYRTFSLDSNSELSKDPAMAKKAGGKNSKIRPKSITIDDDFFSSGRDFSEMKNAMYAKFSQNPELTTLLLRTEDAKLTHYIRGHPPVVFTQLMEVREQLK